MKKPAEARPERSHLIPQPERQFKEPSTHDRPGQARPGDGSLMALAPTEAGRRHSLSRILRPLSTCTHTRPQPQGWPVSMQPIHPQSGGAALSASSKRPTAGPAPKELPSISPDVSTKGPAFIIPEEQQAEPAPPKSCECTVAGKEDSASEVSSCSPGKEGRRHRT